MKKILVTGANGLLGANLLRMLCAGGYEVTAFLRRSGRVDFLQDLDLVYFMGALILPKMWIKRWMDRIM